MLIGEENIDMIKYRIFDNNVEIGLLEINEKGQHRYTPIESQIEYIRRTCSPFWEFYTKSDWREPIPVLQNRINDARRFGQKKDITNQTDTFRLFLKREL